jgi:hypothetical protein
MTERSTTGSGVEFSTPEVPAPEVTRRDELTAAVAKAADAYREAHAFRGLFSVPSGLWSYRPPERPQQPSTEIVRPASSLASVKL